MRHLCVCQRITRFCMCAAHSGSLALTRMLLGRVGKAVTYTFGAVLAIFLLSPAHDMYLLHQQKEASAETLTSHDRR